MLRRKKEQSRWSWQMKTAANTSLQAEGPFKPKWTSHLSDVECYQVEDLASLQKENYSSPWHRGLGCCRAQPVQCAMTKEESSDLVLGSIWSARAWKSQGRQIGNPAWAENRPCVFKLYSLLLAAPLVSQFLYRQQDHLFKNKWDNISQLLLAAGPGPLEPLSGQTVCSCGLYILAGNRTRVTCFFLELAFFSSFIILPQLLR